MNVQAVNSTNFGAKNTFLNKSKNAITRQDKDYWGSLHCEAKARLAYRKYTKAENQFNSIADSGSIVGAIAVSTALLIMAYRKLQSVIFETDAYTAFPNRFAEPDDSSVKEIRHYKIKDNYRNLIKQ